jgi:GNAT superfamily N-acetyltransferase
MATTTSPRSFTLRSARFSDLASAARACTLAFDDDELFGPIIHPHRKAFPRDMDKYWYRRFIIDFWDPSHVFLVTTEKHDRSKKEVVTGFAHWCRIAPEPRINLAAGWGLAWWDLSKHFVPWAMSHADCGIGRAMQPIARLFVQLLDWLSPNRAASAEDENILERNKHTLDHVWTGERAVSWYLENLAVHPDYQKRGQGRALVQWGLNQARQEGVSASVISAEGKERFYQTCGYLVGPVARGGEGEGNELRDVPGGLLFFMDKEGTSIPPRAPGKWMEGHGDFDWDAFKARTYGNHA